MAEAIGKVETLEGEVTVTRADGTQDRLAVGDPVFQGDEIATGNGSLGVTLADQTTFSMAAHGQITLDEMIYDPSTQEGTIAFSVTEGLLTFVSGMVAKTGFPPIGDEWRLSRDLQVNYLAFAVKR